MKVSELFKTLKLDEGFRPGQKVWKEQMKNLGATRFWRNTHGGGTVDAIIAYDKSGEVLGSFNMKS